MNAPRTEGSSHDRHGSSNGDLPAVLDGEVSRAERARYLTVRLASRVVTAVTGPPGRPSRRCHSEPLSPSLASS